MPTQKTNSEIVNPIANLAIVLANATSAGLISSVLTKTRYLGQVLPTIEGYQTSISLIFASVAGVGTYFWLKKLDKTNAHEPS